MSMSAKAALYVSTKGQGPDIVLVHGWGVHSGVWKNTAEHLSQHFRVTVVDLPGYARSSGAYVSGGSGFKQTCRQLAQAITGPAIWIGWSLGGLLAAGVALEYSVKVKQLIMVASAPRFISTSIWQAMPEEAFDGFAEQLQLDYKATLKRFMLLQTRNSENSIESLKILRQQWLQVGTPSRAVLEAGLNILKTTDLRNDLKQLQCPLTFIYGQLDVMARPELLDEMKKYHTDFDSVVIKKAAHAPFLSHPTQFNQHVIKSISQHGVFAHG